MDKKELFDILNCLFVGGYSEDTVLYHFQFTTIKDEFGEDVVGNASLNGRYVAVYLRNAAEYADFWKYLADEVGCVEYEVLTFLGSSKIVVLFTV